MINVVFYLADQHPGRDRTLGVSEYTQGLARQLRCSGECHITELSSPSAMHLDGPGHLRHGIPWRTNHPLGRLLGDQFHLLFSRAHGDVWHYPKGYLPLLGRPRQPTLGTVHDTILQHYADHYPASRSRTAFAYWLKTLARSVSRFDAILTVSESARRGIEEFCARHRLRCPPIHVTYEGAKWEERAGQGGAKEDYVVHLASAQPHKRTSTLLEFWEKAARAGRSWPELRLIGKLSPDQEALRSRIPGTRLMPFLTGDELAAQIARARALILPSEIEGFGLPALEAHYLGTPVVFVRGTAVAEIIGAGQPGGFALDSFDSFDSALQDVLRLDPAAVARHAVGLRDQFSWAACAARTLAVYRTLC